MEHAKTAGYDKIITNDELEEACGSLESFIYDTDDDGLQSLTNGAVGSGEGDVEMADAANGGGAMEAETNGEAVAAAS